MELPQLMAISLLGFAVVVGGLMLLFFGLKVAATTEETVRLRNYVSEPAEQERQPTGPALSFRRAELSGSLLTRLILPWLKQIGRLLGRFTPARMIDDLRRDLTMAGAPAGLGPREFYGVRILVAALGLAAAFMLVRGGVSNARQAANRPPTS